jgi:hypothetical protein
MVSAIASIGSFIINHKTTSVSEEFDLLIIKIGNTLQMSCNQLEGITPIHSIDEKTINEAEDSLLKTFQDLSEKRDINIKKGHTDLNTETLHHLQEAYLISNQLIWLKTLAENLKKATLSYKEIVRNTY